jgi:hypothetical protein
MYTLIRSLPRRRLMLEQGPAFLLALTVAELFYKFHSFLLETMAFLVTWFALDFIVQYFVGRTVGTRSTSSTDAQ